jgi:hypothetical protein
MTAAAQLDLFDAQGHPAPGTWPTLPASSPSLAEFFRQHDVVRPVDLEQCIGRVIFCKLATGPQVASGAYRTLIGVRTREFTESHRGGLLWTPRVRDGDGIEHDGPNYMASNHVAVRI